MKNKGKIQNLITEILSDYGNTAYLRISGKNDFDEVRGSTLWILWYGSSYEDFCVRTIEYYNNEYLQKKYDGSKLLQRLKRLKNNLETEFLKIKK